jgi:uncharacterized protein
MIERTAYLDELISFRDKRVIKVVTGIRRCGKSTLFEIYIDHLRKSGVSEECITSINFEDNDFESLTDYHALLDYLKDRLVPDKMNYIVLDEVQRVVDFQKAVDSLFIKKNCDVYITGSNAYLLSGELATLLSGRYVEIKMMPLSFKEYVSAFPEKGDLATRYRDYLVNSSFPYTLELTGIKTIRTYLDGLYNSVILKDVASRKGIGDITLLESLVRFMFDNIGNLCSVKKIADTMTSAGRKISVHTVENYLEAICGSFILYKAGRYDVKGRQHLKTQEKYYSVDIGLRYYLLGSKPVDAGHVLENIVYLELLRRGYEVYVGKVGASEIDFIARNEEGVAYYQVSDTVRAKETLQRELAPLDTIDDHNPKFLLTMDNSPLVSHNGIRQEYALDWLLS